MQASFGLGYIGISNDLVGLLRCLLLNPTYGSDLYEESPAAASKDGVLLPPPEGTPDMPRTRFWVRRFCGLVNLLYIAATVTGTIANSNFSQGMDNQTDANKNYRLRFVICKRVLDYLVLTLDSFQDCKRLYLLFPDSGRSFCCGLGGEEFDKDEQARRHRLGDPCLHYRECTQFGMIDEVPSR